MRVVLQRVREARVRIDGVVVGEIGQGLLLLVGIAGTDTEAELAWMADKCVQLRIFADAEGKMNRSVLDVEGGVLVVSQFTLYGDARKGNRPSFIDAARPEVAEPLYDRFRSLLAARVGDPRRIAAGRFAADMQVELINDGPVTLLLERPSSTP